MKRLLSSTLLVSVAILIHGCTVSQNVVKCSEKEIFGYATFQKLEDKIAYFTFAVDDASGEKKKYGDSFEIVAPFGVTTSREYPSILKYNCDKYSLFIIREIGTACRSK